MCGGPEQHLRSKAGPAGDRCGSGRSDPVAGPARHGDRHGAGGLADPPRLRRGRLGGALPGAFGGERWAALSRALHRSRLRSFGPANRVTLGRATLVGGVTALVADSFQDSPPVTLFVGLTAVALILDGVDGKVARATGTSTPLGARFDMEVDAFLILVLSVYVSMSQGPWVLLIGAMRYGFVAAARVWNWLNAPLPPSLARKTVAALQGILLLVAASGYLPHTATFGVVAVALGTLVWSFGRDVLWLWRTHRADQAAVGELLELEFAAVEREREPEAVAS